jgi:predicted N-acyltransferase
MVAGALNLIGSHAIYGRQWGCVADREFKGLHFELCYYQVGALGFRLRGEEFGLKRTGLNPTT